MHWMPVFIEVFMSQIVPVLLFKFFYTIANLRICTRINGIGCKQLVGKIDSIIDAGNNSSPLSADDLCMFSHQVAHWCKRSPPRLRVVADIHYSTHLEFAPDKINDNSPIFVRDPA